MRDSLGCITLPYFVFFVFWVAVFFTCIYVCGHVVVVFVFLCFVWIWLFYLWHLLLCDIHCICMVWL